MSGSIPYRCFGAAVSAGFLCGKPSLTWYKALVSSKKAQERAAGSSFRCGTFSRLVCFCRKLKYAKKL